MSFKLNQLELTPDYDAYKDFKISFGKDYDHQVVRRGQPVSQVKSGKVESVSINFPLARETASAGITLQNQVKELVKNTDISEVYLNWDAATHLNGYYTLEDADISIPEGGITGGYAEFSAKLTKLGVRERVQRALQCNKSNRTTAYGTALITPASIHGFPYGSSVFSSSGTFYNRVGSEGNIPVVLNATAQDLFPYEQDPSNIGKGDVRVYDDMGGTNRTNWVEVYGVDHKFIGDVVIENNLIQANTLTGSVFGTANPGRFNLKYFDGTSYTNAGTCSFLETGGVDHGTSSPKLSLNKVSPEESEVVLSYPPAGNSLKVKLKLQRGRWDVLGKPDFVTGSVHGSFIAKMIPPAGFDYVEADGSYSGGTTAGEYAIAMATKNHLVAYDTATAFHQGLSRVATRGHNSTFVINDRTGTVQADTYLSEGSATKNYDGTYSLLDVGYYVVSGAGKGVRSSLKVTFPTSSQVINSATLSLYVIGQSGTTAGRTHWAYKLTEAGWVENQACWGSYKTGSAWATPGGDYATASPAGGSLTVLTPGNWMHFPVTGIVQNASTSGTVNILVKDSDESGTFARWVEFPSMQHASASLRPKLIIANKINELKMATGSDYVSLFAVKPPSGQDTPANLGQQLLTDAEALNQVIER